MSYDHRSYERNFKQLRIEAWKSQDFNGVWTRDLAIKFAKYSLGVYLKYFNHKSEGSIREIFLVLVETMKEEIVSSAQKVQSYGLMVDEVTDISVQSQMLTFIQFVSPVTSCIETAFLSVQNVLEEFASANADALISLIKMSYSSAV